MSDTALHPVQILQANLHKLTASDLNFARSLLSSPRLSEKQHHWIAVLAQRATSEPCALPTADLSAIVALFDKAVEPEKAGKPRRVRAALVFATADGTRFRLSLAGPSSAQPGTINVTDPETSFENRIWYGRITRDGKFNPSQRVDQKAVDAVVAALVAFSADPEGESRKFGHTTGICAYCQHDLDNDHSKALGYGPKCAVRWGLVHSYTRPVAELVAEAELQQTEAA